MTLHQIKRKFQRVRDEIDALDRRGDPAQAKLAWLMGQLERADIEMRAFRQRQQTAPTLRDVVPSAQLARRSNESNERSSAA